MSAERCPGLVFWNQVQGVLLKGKDGYSGFCPVCDREVSQGRKPRSPQQCSFGKRPGVSCKTLVSPQQQVSSKECGRPSKTGRPHCEAHLPSEIRTARLRVGDMRRALRGAEDELRVLRGLKAVR